MGKKVWIGVISFFAFLICTTMNSITYASTIKPNVSIFTISISEEIQQIRRIGGTEANNSIKISGLSSDNITDITYELYYSTTAKPDAYISAGIIKNIDGKKRVLSGIDRAIAMTYFSESISSNKINYDLWKNVKVKVTATDGSTSVVKWSKALELLKVEKPKMILPVEKPVIKAPIIELPIEKPKIEILKENPKIELPIENPVVKPPIKELPIEKPKIEILKEIPKIQLPVEKPVIKAPIKELPVEKPKLEISKDKPIIEFPIDKPVLE